MILDLEVGVFGQPYAQVQIPCRATSHASLSSARYAEALAFCDTGWDLDLVGLCSSNLSRAGAGAAHLTSKHAGSPAPSTRHSAPDLNGADRTAHCFVKCDHNVPFNIASTFVAKILFH